jgi:glutamate synthase (NADPH/NADH) small chain
VGRDLPADRLLAEYDAVVLAGGATAARDLPVPGRQLAGVHQAMEYLPLANRVQEGDLDESPISAAGKDVVIIGGGDTGADCLGTAHRQGAASVHQLEIMARPPDGRSEDNPWPTWPLIFRTSSAHEEGGDRLYAVTTTELVDDGSGQVSALLGHEVAVIIEPGQPPRFDPVPGSEFKLACQLVLLAMGFTGPERPLLESLGVDLDPRGNVARGPDWQTSVPGVFVCGDMGRGQSLIVWAISEGRAAAAAADSYLMGSTLLRSAITTASRPF